MAYHARSQTGGFLMSFVNLVSGGLDSTLIGVMAKEEGIKHYPLFIDYGQLAAHREWKTCKIVHAALDLPAPARMNLSGFGRLRERLKTLLNVLKK
jgi:7-cyano-7-deazaguanine synthase